MFHSVGFKLGSLPTFTIQREASKKDPTSLAYETVELKFLCSHIHCQYVGVYKEKTLHAQTYKEDEVCLLSHKIISLKHPPPPARLKVLLRIQREVLTVRTRLLTRSPV